MSITMTSRIDPHPKFCVSPRPFKRRIIIHPISDSEIEELSAWVKEHCPNHQVNIYREDDDSQAMAISYRMEANESRGRGLNVIYYELRDFSFLPLVEEGAYADRVTVADFYEHWVKCLEQLNWRKTHGEVNF